MWSYTEAENSWLAPGGETASPVRKDVPEQAA
jgi:hypothetical protein